MTTARVLRLAWCKECGRLRWVEDLTGGRCNNCRCDRDCEYCVLPDCIVDDVSEEEAAAADRRDKRAKKEKEPRASKVREE